MLGLNICYYAAASASSKNWLQVAVLQQASGSSGQSSSGESSQPSSSGSSSSSQSSASAGQSESLTPKNVYEGLKKLFSDPNATISGRLGDGAFISAQGISILSGEYYIYIAVGSFSPEQAQTILKQAGELALTNLNRILGK
jgi:hypothetical protein